MRFLSTRFLAVALLPAAAFALATSVRAPVARAEEPRSPLEAADRLEQEGRENLEHGHKVEGAKKISEAWRIRAMVWGSEGGEGQPAPEIAALKEKIEKLRAASGEAERAGHKLKDAGQVEESNAKMEESGRLWRLADELQHKLEAAAHKPRDPRDGDANGDDPLRKDKQVADLKAQAARAREEAKGAEADAKQADADGKEEAAKAARERQARLRERVGMLERQIGELTGGHRAESPHQDGPANELRALKAQMEELRRAVDELRKKLEDKSR